MRARMLGVAVVLAMVLILFSAAGAEEDSNREYSFSMFSISFPGDATVYTKDDGEPYPTGVQYMFDHLTNLYLKASFSEPPYSMMVFVAPPKGDADYRTMDAAYLEGTLLPLRRAEWASSYAEIVDSGYEMMPSGPYLYLHASQKGDGYYTYSYFTHVQYEGAWYTITVQISTDSAAISEEELTCLKDAVQSIVLCGTAQETGTAQTGGTAVHLTQYGYAVSLNLPAGWTEAEPYSWESDDDKWADLKDGKVRQIAVSFLDLYANLSDEAMEYYGFDGRDDMNLHINENMRESFSSEEEDASFSGFRNAAGFTFAMFSEDVDQKIDGQGDVRLHVLTYRTILQGVVLTFTFSASDYEDADLLVFADIINGLVVAGDGPDYDEKSDRRAVSFEKDGHTVGMEIPCYLEVEPSPIRDDFGAAGMWKGSYLAFGAECHDVWDSYTNAEKALFGTQTRDQCDASSENEHSLSAVRDYYDYLDLDWTYAQIGSAVYLVGVKDDAATADYVASHIVHYVTMQNGAMFHFRFMYLTPTPDAKTIF